MHDIFDLLLNARKISPTIASMLRTYCQRWKMTGFHGLLSTHIYDEESLANLLSDLLRMDRVYSISASESGAEPRAVLTFRRARAWECFPCSRKVDGSGQVEIIMADPTQRQRVAQFRQIFANNFSLAVGTRSEIIQCINEHYQLTEQLPFLEEDKSARNTAGSQ